MAPQTNPDDCCQPDRRELLAGGIRGGLGMLLAGGLLRCGLSPALADEAGATKVTESAIRSLVFVFQHGGPSHIDTFDPKPGAPTGGPFKPIMSSIDGVQLGEHLPKIAAQLRHVNLIRSMTSKEGSHDRARHFLQTGYSPAGPVRFPGFGAVIASERNPKELKLPPYVSIGGASLGGGYLGPRWSPFVVQRPDRPVANLEPTSDVDAARLARRRALLTAQEGDFARGRKNKLISGHSDSYERAYAFMSSKARAAFDLSKETEKVRNRYGANEVGLGCLLARRLVEVGVPFISVRSGGWDTHRDNFGRVKTLSNKLDGGVGSLIADLVDRDLLSSTLIVVVGEFGRTPKINANTGRDHWPKAFSCLIGGGGLSAGKVIGKTDAQGARVAERPVTPPDLYATIAQAMSIPRNKVNQSAIGRPFRIVDKVAKPVRALLS